MQHSSPCVVFLGPDCRQLARAFPDFRWIALDVMVPPSPKCAAELSDALGCICVDGAASFHDWWAANIGGPAPRVFDGDPADLGAWLMQALIADRAEIAAQFAGLSGQIGHLRQTVRDQGEEIAYLRQQVDRQQKRFLFDIAQQGRLAQASGMMLEQRLPGEALGLAGLILPLLRGGAGQLVIRLIVTEDQDEVARWQVDDPSDGALRLSLHGPLHLPRRSAQLRLEWRGEEALEWGAAPMDDPLYATQIDEDVQALCLAMRGKNHSFGNGFVPLAPLQLHPLAFDVMARAETRHRDRVRWMDIEQELLVHPVPDEVTAAQLTALVPPGIGQIRVEVETHHIRSGPVSYAIGIAPYGAALGEDGLPEFAPGSQSAWLTIPPCDRHALTLTPTAPDRPHDLWLMTRLPEGAHDSSWGWATFSGLSLWA